MANECVNKKEMLPYILKRCINACNTHNSYLFAQIWNPCEGLFGELSSELAHNDSCLQKQFDNLLKEISEKHHNYALCSDLIEMKLLPMVYEILDDCSKDEFEQDGYKYFPSRSGLYSMKHIDSGEYCYSEVDPMSETWEMARYIYKPDLECAVILGCGLAYLPYQLWKYSEESLDLYILDLNENIFDCARKYGMLDYIAPEKVHTIICENEYDLLDKFKNIETDYEKSKFIISEWMKNVVSQDLKTVLIDYNANQACVNDYAKKYAINRIYNSRVIDGEIDELIEHILTASDIKKEAIVVAAGPSLNDNIAFIKEKANDSTIIAVDGALKKLLSNDIIPDYVTVIDPNNPLMVYINGIEEQTKDITLIAENVSYWKYVSDFQGPKYRVFCVDEPESMRFCEENDIEVWDCGRTVSSLAIEMAVRIKAETVYLVGLDLSYPGNKQHADGIGISDERVALGNTIVRSVTGEMVPTTDTFMLFLEDIEKQISEHPDVTFVNKSSGGAWIKGCLNDKWWEENVDINNVINYSNHLCDEKRLYWDEKYYLFRQMIAGLGTPDEYTEIYDRVCENIVNESNLLSEYAGKKSVEGGIVVLLVSRYITYQNEELLEDALAIINSGYQLLILNTNEAFGGKYIATKQPIQVDYDYIENDNLVYLGKRIPYFQFPIELGIDDIVREALAFITNNNIYRIISYDRYSIVSKLAEKVTEVKYR